MAYASLVSFIKTLRNILHTDQFHAVYPKNDIETLYGNLCALQFSIEKIFPITRNIKDDVDALESELRGAVFKSQDEIESFLLSWESQQIPGDLKEVIADFNPIAEKAKKLADSAGKVDLGTEGGDASGDGVVSSRSTSTSRTDRIVGQEEDKKRVTNELLSQIPDLQTLPIVGMPGIGKTTLARSIYDDKAMVEKFPGRAWVTVSSEYTIRDIFTKLLASIETPGQKGDALGSTNRTDGSRENDSNLGQRVYQTLFDTRYLVVIDDMWETNVWDRIVKFFPENKNGSRIILTTRIKDIADYVRKDGGFYHQMKPLSPDNSWILLSYRVFGDGSCPPFLKDKGWEIAQNCGGLPLSLTVIGGQLSQEKKTVEYWDIIQKDINAAAAAAVKKEELYLDILGLSYRHLPAWLKGCFLYMGGFPEDSDIHLSKLIRLWVAEGFLQELGKNLEVTAEKSLIQLIDRNLITIRRRGPDGFRIKSCGVHDILRDIAVKECGKQKFFHGIKKYSNPLGDGEDTETQRRLSVHKNILMCMEEVYNSAKLVKHARTFLYAGNHHHHPYPFTIDFEYLRVLDALTVYFIEFPDEVLKMIHLSYLSLTYNGKIPSSVVDLRNLQVLIVRQYPKIIYLGTSMLPAEIWKMPKLRHLFFTETELPSASGVEFAKDSVPLANLQSLSNVNAACCDLETLKRFPNLRKLEMWIAAPRALEFHIDRLEALETFKFTVLNPVPGSKIDFQPKLAFPKNLRKLSLSGCGIPWKDMSIIGELEHLEVLKLREFAFHGEACEYEEEGKLIQGKDSEWSPEEGQFLKLKYLLLEGLDLEFWSAESQHFRCLGTLIIRHCYDLVEIPEGIGEIGCLELIEMIDCGPSAVDSARKIKKNQEHINKELQVRIYSSWE